MSSLVWKAQRAVERDNLQVLQEVSEQYPSVVRNLPTYGFTSNTITHAAKCGSVNCLQWLLEQEPRKSQAARTSSEERPSKRVRMPVNGRAHALFAAVKAGNHGAVHMLLENGAEDLCLRTMLEGYYDVLDCAIGRDDAQIVLMLGMAGADLNSEFGQDHGLWETPRKLHHSILRSSLDVVEALLVAGADPCLLWGGCTPRQMLQGLLKQGKLNEPYRYFAFYAGKSRIDKDFVVEALKLLTKWEKEHHRRRLRPILRARSALLCHEDGAVGASRAAMGLPMPVVHFEEAAGVVRALCGVQDDAVLKHIGSFLIGGQ